MNKLLLAIALLSITPALCAQQAETTGNTPQAAAQTEVQTAAQPPNVQQQLPASLRPGHPLDPADVDILTGKRDREIEAARMAGVPVTLVIYGNYGDLHEMNGRFGEGVELPLLPLTRISNPFFLSRLQPRGFMRGRFRGRR
jgi:hypothetical protein